MAELKLNPLQEQLIAAMISGAPYVGVRAGWGSGKTSALVFAILLTAKQFPGTSQLLITDTFTRYQKVLGPEMEKWLGPLGWEYRAGERCWVDTRTGSTVWTVAYWRPGTKAATVNPLEGMNVTSGRVFIDECQTLRPEVATKAFGRIRSCPPGAGPQIVMVGLPVTGAWWVELAQGNGGRALFAPSHVNRANLSEAWLLEAENLPPHERDAMIHNRPAPPTGLVYSDWRTHSWPAGNIAPDKWEWRPEMRTRIAGDWGLRKPHVLIIAHDPVLGADVICGEILGLKDVDEAELVRRILAVAWPRTHQASAPGPRLWLDAGSGDRSGRQPTRDRTLVNTFQVLRQAPPDGLGLSLRWTDDPVLYDIKNGVDQVRRRIWDGERRTLLCAQDVWDAGMQAPGNSLAKAMQSYRYPEDGRSETPIKDGREDPLDALRYDTINWCWRYVVTPAREAPVVEGPAVTAPRPRSGELMRGAGRPRR